MRVLQQQQQSERGSAMIVTILVILLMMGLVTLVVPTAVQRSQATLEGRYRAVALAAAEGGLGLKVGEIADAGGASTSFGVGDDYNGYQTTYELPDATVVVTVWDMGTNQDALGNDLDDDGNGVANSADSTEQNVLRVVATATSSTGAGGVPVVRTIEAFLKSSSHPLISKAIYAGNSGNVPGYGLVLGPRGSSGIADRNPVTGDNSPEHSGAVTNTSTFEASANPYADYVEGDIYVNGDIEIRGGTSNNGTNIYGDVDVVGAATGRPVTGTTTESTGEIKPPDLASVDYDTKATQIVAVNDPNLNNSSFTDATYTGSGGTGGIPSFMSYGPPDTATDHYHQYEYIVDTASGTRGTELFDKPNFHMGGTASTIDFSSVAGADGVFGTADDNNLIVVKGNLWLDTRGQTGFGFPSTAGVELTVVVEGNIYIMDELSYNGGDDAILFIAKGSDSASADENYVDGYLSDGTRSSTDIDGKYKAGDVFVDSNGNGVYEPGLGETYTDTDGNGSFTPGEIIMNDDGDGVYGGPAEGQGNIYFGELVANQGGITDGFMYAQNNAYVMSNTSKQVYGVRGFLNAGNILDLGDGTYRQGGSVFTNYRVKYDDRLHTGAVSLPGVPPAQGGGYAGLEVISWRELPPGSN